MTDNLDHILVFKSDIKTEADKYRVSMELDAHPSVAQWSVDIHDDDRVLRIVSRKLTHSQVIDLVTRCGYQCEELTD